MRKIILLASLFANLCLARENFHFEKDHSLPITYINIIMGAGSAHDSKDKQGLAYISGHMLLRGTQLNSKTEFNKKLDELGGQIGVDVRPEGTVFRGAVLSENLTPFLALFEEALIKPKFDAEEIRKLKKEVEGQILEQKSSDKTLVIHHFQKFFYGNHPYANPILGTRNSIKNIDNKDVVRFHAKYFGGKTLTLFGSGDENSTDIETWFQNLLLKLSALHPDAVMPAPIEKPVIPSGRRALLVNKPKTTQTQVLLGGIGNRPESPGFYEVQLANHSFGGSSFQARLMTEIRVKRGWTYGAYNSFRFGIQPRHYAMYIFPKLADTIPAVKLTGELFEEFVKNGITQTEYEFARDSLVNNAPFNIDSAKKRLENRTSEFLLNFPDGYYASFADNIAKVKQGAITDALKNFFKPADLTLVIVGDASKLKNDIEKIPGFSKPVIKSYLED